MGTQVLAGAPVSRKPPMRLPTTRGDRGYWRWRGSLVNHKVLMCLPSRGWIHIPPWEKENHLQNAMLGGYVSSLEGTLLRVFLVPVGDWHSFVGAVWWSFVHGFKTNRNILHTQSYYLNPSSFLTAFSTKKPIVGEFVQRNWVSNITIHLRWLLFLNFQSDKKQLQTTYRKPTCSYFQPLQFQVCRSCLVVFSTWMCRMAAGSPF